MMSEHNFENYKEWNIEDIPESSGIYCFRNKINGKLYIGQAQKLKTRIKDHLTSKDNLYIHNALRKYGIENFNIYILEFTTLDKLSETEIYYINKFESYQFGYNLTEGGEGTRGSHLSESHKEILRELQNKETWAYNFKQDYFVSAKSRLELSNLLKNKGFDIKDSNIYDALRNKGYSKEFTFGNSKSEALYTAQTITLPKDYTIYLYNFKTEVYSPKFNSLQEAESYIRNCGYKLCTGHLSTAINNNNKYIKDFFFGLTKEELEEKIKNYSKYIFCYYLPENILFRFACSEKEVCEKLKNMGYKANRGGINATKLGKQLQTNGFMIATSMDILIKRLQNYNKDMVENLYELAKENNFLNSQDTIDWQDSLNEISIR